MKRVMITGVVFCCMAALSMCSTLKSVSITQIPKDKSHTVEASASDWAFLGLHSSNTIVETAGTRLESQCPEGNITGILTKYETTWYVLVEERKITVKAFCSKQG